MLKFINFLKKLGFGRGKLKKINNLILENYLKKITSKNRLQIL